MQWGLRHKVAFLLCFSCPIGHSNGTVVILLGPRREPNIYNLNKYEVERGGSKTQGPAWTI